MNSNISAYILCGGKSSRMQTEKGLVKYLDKPFIKWVIEAVLPITSNIFLVTDNQDYSSFGYPLVSDAYKDKGPIGGIYSALNHSESDYILLLSCDIPNITSYVINNYLVKNLSGDIDVTYLSDDSDSYPLIAFYNKRLKSKFLNSINLNKLKLISLLTELDCQNIKVDKKDFNALKNINTKEELENIEKEWQSEQKTKDMITIKYFGEIAEATNCSEEQVTTHSNRLSDVVNALKKKYNLSEFSMIYALNQNLIDINDQITINNNDELAILPPFAGG